MKTKHILLTALSLSLGLTHQLHAQGGSLTPPPGAPAPVMRSLDEIFNKAAAVETQNTSQTTLLTNIEDSLKQVRQSKAVNTLPGDATAMHIITAPGHYHLNAGITGQSSKAGIRINAQNVTLDLNGHTLTGVSGATKGIEVNLTGPVVIRNGTLRAWPQQAMHIINAEYLLQDVIITNTQGLGVDTAGTGVIERVMVKSAVDYGLYCITASPTIIRDCRVEGITSTGTAKGIHAPKAMISRCTVANITGTSTGAESNAVCGISADGGKIESCVVQGITQSAASYCFGIYKARQVHDTAVQQISSTATANVTGIYKCLEISRCTVSTLSSGWNATGIQDGDVSHCSVTTITGGGDAIGICLADNVIGCSVKDITTTNTNNTKSVGIWANNVSHCSVNDIVTSSQIDSFGIYEASQVTHCQIHAADTGVIGKLISQTTVGSAKTGVYLSGKGVAQGNSIEATETGIVAGFSSLVTGNTVVGNSDANSVGILQSSNGYGTRIENNSVTYWDKGINAMSAPSSVLVRCNSAGFCTTPFHLPAGMVVVPITAPGTNPNANVSF